MIIVYSFIFVYFGKLCVVEVGIFYDVDVWFVDGILLVVVLDCCYDVCCNEFYGLVDGVMYSFIFYGIFCGILNVMIEVRNDFIVD